MENKKEMTALDVSAATDTEQPISKCTDNSISEKAGKINDLETISMTELYDTVYPSKPPLIDGLLYTGTYLFVGAPKLGKSYLMAQLAYHISTGTPLWDYTVRKGTVLYLALEDDYRRLQERLYRMFGTDSTDNLFFSVSADSLGNGLDAQLQRFMQEHTDTSLIIIDTLQKVREVGGDNYSYANDYEIITRLKQFADKYGICILLVHHTRKQTADDFFCKKRNAQATPPRLKYRAEISKTKSCTSIAIPKLCCGSWNGQKRSFGKNRPNLCLKR